MHELSRIIKSFSMRKLVKGAFLCFISGFALCSCQNKMAGLAGNEGVSCCKPANLAKNKSSVLTCKLSSKEVQERKMTVLASLRKQVLERKELPNGYAFRFEGSDKVIDELTEFIKTERECCDFFTFNLSISGDKSEAWLELTGVDGAKDFITKEMEL